MGDARELLIEKNLGLVRHVAKRFIGRGVDGEELFQIGSIGLIKAIDRFDQEKGVQLSTYAVPMIIGEIKCFLRDNGPIKISRTIKENAAKAEQAKRDFVRREGREPSLTELADKAKLGREELLLALESVRSVTSLDKVVEGEDGGGHTLLDVIAGEGGMGTAKGLDDGDKEKDRLLDRLLTEQILEKLDNEERKLIGLRYFREETQAEAAKTLGVSQVQVSRREKKILEKIRQFLNS